MRNIRYYFYWKLTLLRDRTPHVITVILDWIRYEVLYDYNDKRHWYD